MKSIHQRALVAALHLGLALAAAPASAVSAGLSNTFQGGSTEGWHVAGSHPFPPVVIETGGPAGNGDGYLELTATGGNGAGSRLAVISGDAWDGNYLTAGVTAITLDAINLGSTALQLRLYFEGSAGSALSTTALNLAVAGGWQHLVFPILPSALTGVNPAAALANVNEMRLFHSVDAIFPPAGVVAMLGVDNITAISAVPEPATAWLWAVGAGALLWPALRRRAQRRLAGTSTPHTAG